MDWRTRSGTKTTAMTTTPLTRLFHLKKRAQVYYKSITFKDYTPGANLLLLPILKEHDDAHPT